MLPSPHCLPKLARTIAASLLITATAALGGCDTVGGWFGEEEDPPLPGERQAVLVLDRTVDVDPQTAALPIFLPPPAPNVDWPQAGGAPTHSMGHLALNSTVREAWRASIGSGSDSTLRLLARPVIADGRIFAMDADQTVSALETGGGRRIWSVDLQPEEERGEAVGGGVAYHAGTLYAGTGYGEVVALNPATGEILWRQRLSGPVRGAPTVVGGRVFVVTIDNQTFALNAADGTPIWEHTGFLETAGILGAVSPAVDTVIAVVPYSSGELFALRVESGRPAWAESLTALRRLGPMASVSDIRGLPVIDDELVFAVSHAGRTVAIDRRTGARVWEQSVGGVNTPWVAGDLVFVLTNENELVALTRQFGQVRWATSFPRFEDPEDREDPIFWSGPVLAGGRLWLASSTGELTAVAPETGDVVSTQPIPGEVLVAPLVANNTLYVVTDGGTLVAYR